MRVVSSHSTAVLDRFTPEVEGLNSRNIKRCPAGSTRRKFANVRQVRKRTTKPSILEPEEITSILRELEGVEPVRTGS